ncbi:MAG: XdhC family protein [Saprospiraceae bacterium]|nr:XdhC family protein [Saprospiraceae bacterium]
MIDILQDMEKWRREGKEFALATVVKTWRSAPRGVGATMMIDSEGKMVGSVSGGCVEGQVVKEAQKILKEGGTALLNFGVSNDDAWSVGLSCGGAISVYVQPFFADLDGGSELWQTFLNAIGKDAGFVLIYSDGKVGYYSEEIYHGPFSDSVFDSAASALRAKECQTHVEGDSTFFYHVFPPRNKLIVIGAAHITRDLIQLAKQQDFSIAVIDPRGLFYDSLKDLVEEKSLFRQWPAEVLPQLTLDSSAYAVLLTHDPKIDDQALHILLKSKVEYIGALGSRKTQQRRVTRLDEAGFSRQEISRIHGPVGLDIGAQNAAEIALSIMSEIIKVKNKVQDPGN